MDAVVFQGELTRDGFGEAEEKSWRAGTHNDAHAHGFDLRALVLEGEITVAEGGQSETFGPGEVFTMADGCEHEERIGARGVRFLVGRRSR